MRLLKTLFAAVVLFAIVGVFSVIDYRDSLRVDEVPLEGFFVVREMDICILIGFLLALVIICCGWLQIRKYEKENRDLNK